MKRCISVLTFCLLLTIQSFAQQPASADPPSREQVLRLMEVLRVNRQMDTVFDLMSTAFRQSFLDSMKKRFPNAPASMADDISKLLQDYMVKVGRECRDDMLAEMAVVYQQNLSRDDVESITAFYSSPVGQRLIDKLPLLMRQGGEIGQRVFQRRAEQLTAEVDVKMRELMQKYAPAAEKH